MASAFKFIDLFCGIGGFHSALASLGGECVFASDIDKDCRKTYMLNYGLEPAGDITAIAASDIPAHDVLCAGFPCQAFSKAGKRLGFDDPTKGTLFFEIMRIVDYHKPRYLLLENVRNLASHDGGNTWKVIHDRIRQAGYNLGSEPVIFSPHMIGIPQHRERVFIMCARADTGPMPEFHFPQQAWLPCSIESILQPDSEIAGLERYQLPETTASLIALWDEFVKGINCDRLPGFPIWSDRLRDLDPAEDLNKYPRWRANFIRKNAELYAANRAFIDAWLRRAKANPAFKGAKAKFEWQAGAPEHPGVWDTIMHFRPSGLRVKPPSYFPALVAITQTSIVGRRRRYLTPRECARLQSFPDTFVCDPKDQQAYKQFGNAVNVEVVRLMARFLLGDSATRLKYSRPT